MTTEDLKILTDRVSADDAPFLRPGKWWHREDDLIVCDLCPRKCRLHEGDRGFCFVRQRLDDSMVLTTYGRSTGFCIDPIEKKPLNQFYPGTSVLSFGTAGCNLGCKFCQNWDISKSREVERLSSVAWPETIARAAQSLGCRSVAFTYNDPVIWAEYAIDTARACHELGIKSVAVTAGYITPEARGEFYEVMDGANVDLKAFTEDFYYKLTLSHLDPVLDTIRWLKTETDVWFEITNLIIPDANDSPDEMKRLAEWVLQNVGDEVPVHFTAFHPDYRMTDRPPTPPETLSLARDIAMRVGLKYVYTGNVDDVERQSTYCPSCGKVLIERNWYELGQYNLKGNRCGFCDQTIAGRFAEKPGDWGRRRMPVDMRQFADPRDLQRLASLRTQSGSAAASAAETHAVGNPSSAARPEKNATDNQDATMTTTLELTTLTEQQQQAILTAASEMVVAVVNDRPIRLSDPTIGGLADVPVHGTFVSLKRGKQLRGCCGLVGQVLPLADSLEGSARSAATRDPRFPPVTPVELPHLTLEVWLLGPSEPVPGTGADRAAEVRVGRDGLQVIQGSRRGLLLPSVPVEQGWNEIEFLEHTCLKAGLPPDAWRDEATSVLRFPGVSMSRPLVGSDTVTEPAAASDSGERIFSAREFAQLTQHCRANIDALLEGAVPAYYSAQATDRNVAGVGIIVSRPDSDGDLIASRLSLRNNLPLQATLHSLCEDTVRLLRQLGFKPGTFETSLLITADPAMHGVVSDAEMSGFDAASRGLIVLQGNRSAFVFDPSQSADELLKTAEKAAGITTPHRAQVLSFATQTNHNGPLTIASRPRPTAGPAVRPPAVAGTFYPSDPAEANAQLDEMLRGSVQAKPYPAAMVPHAGWMFSGRLAADVLKRIQLPETIIVIGPKHTVPGVEWAVAPHRTWALPTGDVQSDQELAFKLVESIPGLQPDAAAHEREHGTEVELPIIHRLSPQSRVVGITIGEADLAGCDEFADGLAKVISEMPEPPLLLISSDMNHFANDAETRRLDEMALQQLDRLDPEGLLRTCREHNISMCGVLPAVIVLKTLQRLGRLHSSERVGYATSCDVTGDASRVVGYAGMLFS